MHNRAAIILLAAILAVSFAPASSADAEASPALTRCLAYMADGAWDEAEDCLIQIEVPACPQKKYTVVGNGYYWVGGSLTRDPVQNSAYYVGTWSVVEYWQEGPNETCMLILSSCTLNSGADTFEGSYSPIEQDGRIDGEYKGLPVGKELDTSGKEDPEGYLNCGRTSARVDGFIGGVIALDGHFKKGLAGAA